MFVVLTPIDEHFSFAQRFRHIRSDKIEMFTFEVLSECSRQIFRLIERDRSIQRHVDLETFGAARFRKAIEFYFA